MWFNSTVNEKPYQDWKSRRRGAETCLVRKNGWTGAAWPSSARGLNCSLKWGNERNPRCVLYVSHKTARPKVHKFIFCVFWAGRKERMTPGQHGPLMSWATHMLQWLLQRDAMVRAGANPER